MTTCECGNEAPDPKGRDGRGICPRCRKLAAESRDLSLKKSTGVKVRSSGLSSMQMDWENHWLYRDPSPIAGIGESLKYLEQILNR